MESLSPYEGMHSEVIKQFPYQLSPIMRMLEGQTDFDCDAFTPLPGPYVKLTQAERDQLKLTNGYLTKLEDIDSSWALQWLNNTLVGLKIRAKQGLKEYEYEHPTTYSFVDDEGKTLEESDMLIEGEEEYSVTDVTKAKEKLPYILKRLHARSKVTRIHLLSLIIAYEKAKKNSGRKGPTITSIAEQGVYFMREDGYVGTHVIPDDNKNGPFKEMSGWILGYRDKIDSYFDNMLELLEICDVLRIDITREDPLDYQEDFMSRLTANYIAKNKAYIYNKRIGVNPVVFNALKGITLDDYDVKPEDEVRKKTFMDLYPDTMQVFLDAELPNVFKDEIREQDLAVFFTHYNQIVGGVVSMDKLITKDGFLFLTKAIPLVLNMTRICKEDVSSKSAIFHISGYAILITDTNDFYFQDVNVLTRYLESLCNGTQGTETFGNNTKFGTWKEAMV